MSQLLTSWKEIAQYLGKGVRTVQRWELHSGLPITRPLDGCKKAVMADTRDIDLWLGRVSDDDELPRLRARVAELERQNLELQRRVLSIEKQSVPVAAALEFRQHCELLQARAAELGTTLARTIAIASEIQASRDTYTSSHEANTDQALTVQVN